MAEKAGMSRNVRKECSSSDSIIIFVPEQSCLGKEWWIMQARFQIQPDNSEIVQDKSEINRKNRDQ